MDALEVCEENHNKNSWSQFENFPEDIWEKDLAVSLKGSFFCCQVFGSDMAKNKNGVILDAIEVLISSAHEW